MKRNKADSPGLPTVLLTLVFDFCAIIDLVPAGCACRAWLQAPKNHCVWPRMGTEVFEAALRVLGPSRLKELELDLGSSHPPSIRRLERGMSQCLELASLSVWTAEVGTSRLLRAAVSLLLTRLHLDAGPGLTRFHYPCMNSSITHLSLVRTHLGGMALHVLRSLRVLKLEACVLSPNSLAYTLGTLESLTAHDNSGSETVVSSSGALRHPRSFLDLRILDLSGEFGAEVLNDAFARLICESTPRLETLKLASSSFADTVAARALSAELKDEHLNLQHVELSSAHPR